MRSDLSRRSFLAALVAVPAAAAFPAFPASLVAHDAALGISIRFVRQFDPTTMGLRLHPDAFAMAMRPLEIGDGWAQHACGLKSGDVAVLEGKFVTLG